MQSQFSSFLLPAKIRSCYDSNGTFRQPNNQDKVQADAILAVLRKSAAPSPTPPERLNCTATSLEEALEKLSFGNVCHVPFSDLEEQCIRERDERLYVLDKCFTYTRPDFYNICAPLERSAEAQKDFLPRLLTLLPQTLSGTKATLPIANEDGSQADVWKASQLLDMMLRIGFVDLAREPDDTPTHRLEWRGTSTDGGRASGTRGRSGGRGGGKCGRRSDTHVEEDSASAQPSKVPRFAYHEAAADVFDTGFLHTSLHVCHPNSGKIANVIVQHVIGFLMRDKLWRKLKEQRLVTAHDPHFYPVVIVAHSGGGGRIQATVESMTSLILDQYGIHIRASRTTGWTWSVDPKPNWLADALDTLTFCIINQANLFKQVLIEGHGEKPAGQILFAGVWADNFHHTQLPQDLTAVINRPLMVTLSNSTPEQYFHSQNARHPLIRTFLTRNFELRSPAELAKLSHPLPKTRGELQCAMQAHVHFFGSMHPHPDLQKHMALELRSLKPYSFACSAVLVRAEQTLSSLLDVRGLQPGSTKCLIPRRVGMEHILGVVLSAFGPQAADIKKHLQSHWGRMCGLRDYNNDRSPHDPVLLFVTLKDALEGNRRQREGDLILPSSNDPSLLLKPVTYEDWDTVTHNAQMQVLMQPQAWLHRDHLPSEWRDFRERPGNAGRLVCSGDYIGVHVSECAKSLETQSKRANCHLLLHPSCPSKGLEAYCISTRLPAKDVMRSHPDLTVLKNAPRFTPLYEAMVGGAFHCFGCRRPCTIMDETVEGFRPGGGFSLCCGVAWCRHCRNADPMPFLPKPDDTVRMCCYACEPSIFNERPVCSPISTLNDVPQCLASDDSYQSAHRLSALIPASGRVLSLPADNAAGEAIHGTVVDFNPTDGSYVVRSASGVNTTPICVKANRVRASLLASPFPMHLAEAVQRTVLLARTLGYRRIVVALPFDADDSDEDHYNLCSLLSYLVETQRFAFNPIMCVDTRFSSKASDLRKFNEPPKRGPAEPVLVLFMYDHVPDDRPDKEYATLKGADPKMVDLIMCVSHATPSASSNKSASGLRKLRKALMHVPGCSGRFRRCGGLPCLPIIFIGSELHLPHYERVEEASDVPSAVSAPIAEGAPEAAAVFASSPAIDGEAGAPLSSPEAIVRLSTVALANSIGDANDAAPGANATPPVGSARDRVSSTMVVDGELASADGRGVAVASFVGAPPGSDPSIDRGDEESDERPTAANRSEDNEMELIGVSASITHAAPPPLASGAFTTSALATVAFGSNAQAFPQAPFQVRAPGMGEGPWQRAWTR
jgi:hypothetical protein